MNVYKSLNDITKYIDDNLDNEIDYDILANYLNVNSYTMQRIFSLLTGLNLSEYIRKRRLSNAGFDLYNKKGRIMDIAVKYQYNNATAFSRAFMRFHGIKPSLVNKNIKLKNFPRIIFDENVKLLKEIDYEIVVLDEMNLYGMGIKTSNEKIGHDAPLFSRK